MNIFHKISIVGLIMLFACSAYAGEKVAVLDFKSILAPAELGIAVAEILRTELVGLGDYTVIERGMLEQIFREQELQLTGAVDSETAVEIGKLVGARLVVIGSIVKTGAVYTINSRFIDVETGVAKVGQNIRGQGEDQISLMVQQLALIITGKAVKTEEIMVSSVSLPDSESETDDTANQTGKPAIAPFVFDFEDQNNVEPWQPTNDDRHISIKQSQEHSSQGSHSLKAKLPKASSRNEYPGIYTDSFPQDWSSYRRFVTDLYFEREQKGKKKKDVAILLTVRIDDVNSTSYENRFHWEDVRLEPGKNDISIPVEEIGNMLDTSKIEAVYIFLQEPEEKTTLYFDNIRLE